MICAQCSCAVLSIFYQTHRANCAEEEKEKCCMENGNFNRKVTMVEKYKEQKMQDRYALPLSRVQEQSL
jgi:hypothetical protein